MTRPHHSSPRPEDRSLLKSYLFQHAAAGSEHHLLLLVECVFRELAGARRLEDPSEDDALHEILLKLQDASTRGKFLAVNSYRELVRYCRRSVKNHDLDRHRRRQTYERKVEPRLLHGQLLHRAAELAEGRDQLAVLAQRYRNEERHRAFMGLEEQVLERGVTEEEWEVFVRLLPEESPWFELESSAAGYPQEARARFLEDASGRWTHSELTSIYRRVLAVVRTVLREVLGLDREGHTRSA